MRYLMIAGLLVIGACQSATGPSEEASLRVVRSGPACPGSTQRLCTVPAPSESLGF